MQKPLRLWPGVVALVVQWIGWYVVPYLAPDGGLWGMLTGAVAALVIIVWWLFFSRAPWVDRIGAIALIPAAVFAARSVVHVSIQNGAQGMMIVALAIPMMSLALVAWAVGTRGLSDGPRRAWLFAAIGAGCATFMLVRTDGIRGAGGFDMHWRWTPTAEQRLLAQGPEQPVAAAPVKVPETASTPAAPAVTPPTAPAAAAAKTAAPPHAPTAEPPAIWPGFRGPQRDGVVHADAIDTDWSKTPPVELWRRKIGPGWSSFAVRGDLVYTQEQRGDNEDVSAYSLQTGKLVWQHHDAARFWESNGGAGPRATPAVVDGRVYSLGATGILNALEADTGAAVWSRNAAADTAVETPGWGFAGSPLVLDDVVVVALSGRLAAYDIATGRTRWLGPKGGSGYSSPHLVTLDGVPQIVLLRGSRTIAVAPADGTLLWEHVWDPGTSIVQPAVTADGDLLITDADAMGGFGVRRLSVSHGDGGWHVEERWTSRGLKPYFNDYVVHKGHAYGFDGSILSCIDLTDGARKWKGGRYGNGQAVLLAAQDLLLVLSEDGELALVKATPDQFTEIARFRVLEGKTWNHPVVVGGRVLVRNGEEMAAFRLPLAVQAGAPPTR